MQKCQSARLLLPVMVVFVNVRASSCDVLCEKTGIGVISTFMAKGCVDMDADYCMYTIGLQAKDVVACALDAADLVITLGYDMVEYHPHLWNKHKDKDIVHIDFLPAEIDENYHPEVEVVGDLAHALWMLNERFDEHGVPAYELNQQAATRRDMQAELEMYKDDNTARLDQDRKRYYGMYAR